MPIQSLNTMFTKILVAIDMSPMAEEVFAAASSLAKINRAKLFLLHIISSEEENSPLPIPPDVIEFYPAAGNELTIQTWQKQWDDYIKQGLDLLQKYSEKAMADDIEVEFHQSQGSPARTICKFAREHQVDLIAIGRRGRTGLSEILLGSVSNYVLHHAPCSVLTVQKKAEKTID